MRDQERASLLWSLYATIADLEKQDIIMRDALITAHYDLVRIASADWSIEQIRMAAEASASKIIGVLKKRKGKSE